MKFDLTLTEQDYLINTLFIASKSSRVKKNRIKMVILMAVLCLVASLNSYLSNSIDLAAFFLILAVAIAFLYPVYQRWYYKKHYLKFVKDAYKNRFGKTSEIEFNEEQLITKDFSGEAKMNLSEIEHIYETADYYFVKFNTGETLILPKEQIQSAQFSILLTEIITKYDLEYSKELNWKWK